VSLTVRAVEGGADLERLAATLDETGADTGITIAGLVDWRRQAEEMLWLLAERDGGPVGAAVALVGWHNPRHIGMTRFGVLEAHRGAGAGSALLDEVSAWLRDKGARELESQVHEEDPDSLAWAARRGLHEVGRSSLLVLELEGVEAPSADPPRGIEIVVWADRPELARGMYEVAREASPDIPGNEEDDIGSFEEWLSRDMQGSSDRADATFVAVADGEVVGFAKFAIAEGRQERAFHDLTGVRRAWRGRGIAGALKRTQIAWAKANGFSRLETFNEERNEPIRRLNERHGYRVEPGTILVRGSITGGS
jgi:GNAT superfamily N-acetyltransferase